MTRGLNIQLDLFGVEAIQRRVKKIGRHRDYDAEAKALLEAAGIFEQPKEVKLMILAQLLADELPATVLQTAFILSASQLSRRDGGGPTAGPPASA